jgi:uncharacterized protein (TIGR02147 family)
LELIAALDVYKYKDYRQLLKYRIQLEGRGAHGRMAEAAKCQSSYLSQVLAGTSQLTAEQAYAVASTWGLDEDGLEYVTGLVHLDRASTSHYRMYWDKKLKNISRRKEQLSERLTTQRKLTGEEQAKYYATWFYPAIHTLAAIPKFQTITTLAARLNIARDIVARAAGDLHAMGLVTFEGESIKTIAHDVHSRSSGLIVSHHNVWRNIANQRLQDRAEGSNYHYTALYGLSEKDVSQLKELVTNFIRETRHLVAPSKEETAVCLAVDLFEI